MVISPMLRGMFGLEFDAQARTLTFAPHPPANWNEFAIRHVSAGSDSVDLRFERAADSITLTAQREGGADVKLAFRPALSARAEILGVTFNGRHIAFRLEPHHGDQHVIVDASLASGANTLKIFLSNDFAVTYAALLPALGSSSEGLRIVDESWNASRNALTLQTEGIAGHSYTIAPWGKEQIKSIDGAKMTPDGFIEETFPAANGSRDWQKQTVTIHLVNAAKQANRPASSNDQQSIH